MITEEDGRKFEHYLMKGLEDALFEGEQDKEIITKNKQNLSPLEIPNGYKQGVYLGLKFYRKWGEYNGKTN